MEDHHLTQSFVDRKMQEQEIIITKHKETLQSSPASLQTLSCKFKEKLSALMNKQDKRELNKFLFNFFRIAGVGAFLFLFFSVIWASAREPLFEGIRVVAGDVWGMVNLVDIYLGFCVFSVLVWLVETDKRVALACIASIFFLGNLTSTLWLAVRLHKILPSLKFLRVEDKP